GFLLAPVLIVKYNISESQHLLVIAPWSERPEYGLEGRGRAMRDVRVAKDLVKGSGQLRSNVLSHQPFVQQMGNSRMEFGDVPVLETPHTKGYGVLLLRHGSPTQSPTARGARGTPVWGPAVRERP